MIERKDEIMNHHDWVLWKRIKESNKTQIFDYIKRNDKWASTAFLILMFAVILFGLLAVHRVTDLEVDKSEMVSQEYASMLSQGVCNAHEQGQHVNTYRVKDKVVVVCEKDNVVIIK